MRLMLYLFIDKYQIKLLTLKKTLLGQYESAFYEKTHQVELLQNGKISNTDLLASAIKESINSTSSSTSKDKDICVILPQDTFHFLRAAVPADIAPSAIEAFIKEKARSQMPIDIEESSYDYIIQENDKEQEILFYAFNKEILQKYQEVFTLLGMQLQSVVPEVLTYFKLFEKTLRKDKKEYILYISYENNTIFGYLYDSYGPLDTQKWTAEVTPDTVESVLREKVIDYETQGKKINRIILSGVSSDTVRQDTFTKNVGAWTNPLKRIIPQFYQDYLKLLVIPENKSLPLLTYDACIGAFIFSLENKNFSIIKKKFSDTRQSSTPKVRKSIKLPMKEIGIFLASFVLSFIVLLFISKSNFNFSKLNLLASKAQPTPTVTPAPQPTATPAPAINKADIRIKILNGSGIAGKASDVSSVLEDKGYKEILTGNADNFDYTRTEIQAKDKTTANLIKTDLKSNVANPLISTLDKDNASDVVIIFGTDFK